MKPETTNSSLASGRYFSPEKIMESCSSAGVKKCSRKTIPAFLLAVLAGALIAFAAAGSSTAAHSASGVGQVRLISAMLFPFGLAIIILSGAELFTGNCLITVSLMDKKVSFSAMIKNWLAVYAGNLLGALAVAALCAFCGQLDYSSGKLAVFSMKIAEAKCSIGFFQAFFMGIACNVLVCLGVLCSMSAGDTGGKILAAFLPVALFVLCGFEHSIANMYYIPVGIFAKSVPGYLSLASEAGINPENISWLKFFLNNLIPVTAGNIAGGSAVGLLLWYSHKSK